MLTLTTSQKIKEYGSVEKWCIWVMDTLDNHSNFLGQRLLEGKESMRINMDLSNGIFNPEDYRYMTSQVTDKVSDYKFPAELEHFDRISPKLNLLKGEEVKRPFNYMCVSENHESFSAAEQERVQMLVEYYMSKIQQSLQTQQQPEQSQQQPQQGQEQQEQPKTPPEIERYMKYTYKDFREEQANAALRYLTRKIVIDQLFLRGFNDYLVTGSEIYYSYIIGQDVKLRRVNPLNIEYDISDDIEYLDEASWIREFRYLTASEIYDEFYEYLSDEDMIKIEGLKSGTGDLAHSVVVSFNDPVIGSQICVRQLEWKAPKRIGFLTMTDPATGEVVEEVVPEDFKVPKELKVKYNVKVEWKWINEVWEGTKIGTDIYVRMGVKENQYRSMDNLSECKLGYSGVYTRYGFFDKMKPYQFLFNAIMYKLKLALATSVGQVFLMDISQIPNQLGIDKWMWYLKQKLAFIDSSQLNEAGRLPGFNQFQEVNLSAYEEVKGLLEILMWIDQQLGEICGVTRERQGQTQQTETLGGIERSITQSSHSTEPYFNIHNEVKRRTLTLLLETAKTAWKEGKKGQFIFNDLGREFFTLDEGFVDTDYSVFVSNHARDYEILQTIKELAGEAMKGGQIGMIDVVEIMQANDVVTAKRILREAMERIQKAQQQQAEQEKQTQMQLLQQQQQMEQQKLQQDYMINQENNQTSLTIEQMKLDASNDDEKNQLEAQKLQFEAQKAEGEREKIVADIEVSKQKAKSEEGKNEVEREKVQVEREKIQVEAHFKQEELKYKEKEMQLEIQKTQAELEIKKMELLIKQQELENMKIELQLNQQQHQQDLQFQQQKIQLEGQQMQQKTQMEGQNMQQKMDIEGQQINQKMQMESQVHEQSMQMGEQELKMKKQEQSIKKDSNNNKPK